MGNVGIVATISKEAWKLIKAGKATLEKGGVKVDGKFIELLKPTLQRSVGGALNPVLGGLNLASSVGCNVQCAFIQKGVNQANQKLDVVIDKLDDLSSAVGKLGQIQAVSWLNCAVGIANMGISIAGFYITSKKLDKLDVQIKEINSNILQIKDLIVSMELKEKVRNFQNYVKDMKADIHELKKDMTDKSDFRDIRSMLNEVEVFLEELINEFGREPEFNELYCHMIFILSELFEQEINIFAAKYYYTNGEYPDNYLSWINIFNILNSEEFRSKLRRYITFSMPRTPFSVRKNIYDYSTALTNNQAFQLAYNYELVGKLSLEDYMNTDTFMLNRIKQTEQPIMLEDGSIAF